MTGAEDHIVMCTSTLLTDPLASCTRRELTAVLEATAAAGCSGTSLWTLHYFMATTDEMTDEELVELHSGLGLSVSMIEAVTTWATRPDEPDAVMADARPAIDIADRLGASQIVAVTMNEQAHPDAAAGLAIVCDAAAERGMRVGVEFLPWSAIPDLRTAWRLVEESGRDNAGLHLDTFHWQRQPGGPDDTTLRHVPGERIHVLQICDCPATPSGDVADQAMTGRLVPGDGDIDLVSIVRTLDELGAEPLIASEVLNPGLLADGTEAFARRVVDATRAVLASARA